MNSRAPKRIAYYGGSFDPPHSGHLGVARAAVASGRTDRVLFAPAFVPPHKVNSERASFRDRCNMVKLLIGGEPGFALCDIEGRLKLTPSYTIDVLAAAEHELKQPVQLLIGGDSLRDLHLWHRAEELVRRHEILTYPRRGEMPEAGELDRHWPPELARKLRSGILDGSFFEISSTNVRNSMAKLTGTVHINSGVPESIEEYIRQHNLYRRSQEMENMTEKKKISSAELADFCAACALEKKAENVLKIHVGPASSVADWFVISAANSEPQLRALVSFTERELREKFQLRPLSQTGESVSGWMVLDFGNVIVHFMTPETRDRYNLEGLWGEKPAEEALHKLAGNRA